jgi:hypothetical protein
MQKLLCRYKDTFPENYEFIFLDTEASSLWDGYPIEAAWISESGEMDTFLIKPMDFWLKTKHWSRDSEVIHNIEFNHLMADGICVISAVERLNERLKGKIVICDALSSDGEWLGELHEAADIAPTYMLTDILYWYSFIGKDKARQFRKLLAVNNSNKTHRALDDAKVFIDVHNELKLRSII